MTTLEFAKSLVGKEVYVHGGGGKATLLGADRHGIVVERNGETEAMSWGSFATIRKYIPEEIWLSNTST